MPALVTSCEPVGPQHEARVGLPTIARSWGRIGCIGFGGPPAHIALLRRLCVVEQRWLTSAEFEDGIAVTNLLPGPASTQLAILCAWKLRGSIGAVVGGVCFIAPGLVAILALSALFLSGHPPVWVRSAAAGAGAAVPAVALQAAAGLVPGSLARLTDAAAPRLRWGAYVAIGALTAATRGPLLVVVLVGCGLVEAAARRKPGLPGPAGFLPLAGLVPARVVGAAAAGGLGALAWVAVRVGALSYGGGFVIIPLMQHDAVHTYHWMTSAQFLDAVALGQITPGPVVQTVAVVGYAAAGVAGGLLAAVLAFSPSFLFVLLGAPRLDRLRASTGVHAFLGGAGPAAIGGIAGSTVPLLLSLGHGWQFGVSALAVVWLLVLRRGVVAALVGAGVLGVVAVLVVGALL